MCAADYGDPYYVALRTSRNLRDEAQSAAEMQVGQRATAKPLCKLCSAVRTGPPERLQACVLATQFITPYTTRPKATVFMENTGGHTQLKHWPP